MIREKYRSFTALLPKRVSKFKLQRFGRSLTVLNHAWYTFSNPWRDNKHPLLGRCVTRTGRLGIKCGSLIWVLGDRQDRARPWQEELGGHLSWQSPPVASPQSLRLRVGGACSQWLMLACSFEAQKTLEDLVCECQALGPDCFFNQGVSKSFGSSLWTFA